MRFEIRKGEQWSRPFCKRITGRFIGFSGKRIAAIFSYNLSKTDAKCHHKLFGLSAFSFRKNPAHWNSDRVVAYVDPDDENILFRTYCYRDGELIGGSPLGSAKHGDKVVFDVEILRHSVQMTSINMNTQEVTTVMNPKRNGGLGLQLINFAHANNGPSNPGSKSDVIFHARRTRIVEVIDEYSGSAIPLPMQSIPLL